MIPIKYIDGKIKILFLLKISPHEPVGFGIKNAFITFMSLKTLAQSINIQYIHQNRSNVILQWLFLHTQYYKSKETKK